jgi:hypothetical protein
MASKANDNLNTNGYAAEDEALMAVYNAEPPVQEQPARFYWQEPWHGADPDEAVQAAFES